MSWIKPIYYDTLDPFRAIEHTGIQYTPCRDYNHLSRYRGLRQLVHNPNDIDRFMMLESPNPLVTESDVIWYIVPYSEQNRLDLIAKKFLGSETYSWIISYMNDIEDGYTVYENQRLAVLKDLSSLFNVGELLAPVPPLQLNLGWE